MGIDRRAASVWQVSAVVRVLERAAVRRLGIQTPAVHNDDLALIEERAGLRALRVALRAELDRAARATQAGAAAADPRERDYREVAVALGSSEQAARARVSRGLRALAAALEPGVLESEESNV